MAFIPFGNLGDQATFLAQETSTDVKYSNPTNTTNSTGTDE